MGFQSQLGLGSIFLLAVACSDADSSVDADTSGAVAKDGSSNMMPPHNEDSGAPTAPGPDSAVVPGNGTTETCDGIDNDEDGIVDDLDVGNDGVCDCLTIATLGTSGDISQGDVFADWLNKRSNAGAEQITTFTASELAKYQVVVIQNLTHSPRTFTEEELSALEQWVEGGGGLLTLTGYSFSPVDPDTVNSILERFGMSYKTTPILLNLFGTVAVSSWVSPHPVTDGITKIGFNNGYPVTGDGTVLASQDGNDVLMAKEIGKGRVLAWGDEWITFNSEWQTHSDYQVERFWENMIKWLTPPKECQVPIVVLK